MLGLLLPNSLRYSQYAFKYAQILDEHGVDYEFVYWNRDGMPLDVGRAFFFDEQMDDFLPLRNKGSMLLKYASFAKKTIRERAYNGLIVFTSQMAVMLMPMLLGPYKDRYIFDYRDISYEKIVPYRLAVAAIARRSRFTSISSPAFRDVIGAGSSSFIISHNERGAFCENPQKALSNDKLIRIAFWGIIRQPDFNKLVCRRIGSDDRFSLTYHGSGCSKRT